MSINAVAISPNGFQGAVMPAAEFTNQQIEMIKHSMMPGSNDLEFDLFLNLCKAKRLDPLTKQIYAVKVGGKWQTFASIDGLRVIAERSGNYGGQTEPYWCGPDGVWREVWLEDFAPSAAKVGVWKRGYANPTWGVATFRSYGAGKSNNWVSMPDVMLAKCAEALALRKAFPDDLSALYVREEFADSADPEMPAQPSRPAQANVVRAEPIPVHAEVVDAQTGEIKPTIKSVGQHIKVLRDELGLSVDDVREEAQKQGFNLKTLDGLIAMRDVLVDWVEQSDEMSVAEAEQAARDEKQAQMIEAEVVTDRWRN